MRKAKLNEKLQDRNPACQIKKNQTMQNLEVLLTGWGGGRREGLSGLRRTSAEILQLIWDAYYEVEAY